MTISKTILVAPLNWGLGHATRCIPIIHQLLADKHHVILASDGVALQLLKQEFPALQTETLPSYNITYPKNGNFTFHMLKSAPGILKSIDSEHQTLKELVVKWSIDIIISDHRYGMYHADVESILIAHQIKIIAPIGENILASLHQKYLAKFDALWIPDSEGEVNLSGKLSHHTSLPKNSKYIGVLSRFSSPLAEKIPNGFPAIKPFVLALVSGPEPQRSVFENILLKELGSSEKLAVVVGGNPNASSAVSEKNIIHYPFLTSQYLKWLIMHSELIVCRSGYSTVMDLVALSKPAVLVATPGQTEQEYLAEYLSKYSMFSSISQKQFTFETAAQKGADLTLDKSLLEVVNAAELKPFEGVSFLEK